MDHQWHPRPPPPIQGNTCPICSISHFPFCPTPHTLPFNQNPRLHPNNMESLKRPFYDPFIDHPSARAPPFTGDRFGDPPPWHRNTAMDYGHLQAQPQIGDYGVINGGRANDFDYRNEFGTVGSKRMRVDEMGTGSFVNESMLTVNERRLKLIREHGGSGGGDIAPGTGTNAYGKSPGFLQEKAVSDRNVSSVENQEQERFDALRFGRNNVSETPHSKYDLGDYSDSRYSDLDRKQYSSTQDSNYGLNPYEKDNGSAPGSENLHGYRGEGIGLARYDQRENGLYPRKDQLGGGLETAYYAGAVRGDSDLGDRYSTSAPYSTSKLLTDKYYQHSFESPPPQYSLTAKEGHHSHHTASTHRSNFPLENHGNENDVARPYDSHNPVQLNNDMNSYGQPRDWRNSYEADTPSHEGTKDPLRHQYMAGASQFGTQYYNKQDGHVPFPSGRSIFPENPMQASRALDGHPPLPASPPPPLPVEPPRHPMYESHSLSPPAKTPSLFPITGAPSATPTSNFSISEPRPLARPYFHERPRHQASTGFGIEEFRSLNQTFSSNPLGDRQPFPLISSERPKFVDASHLFKKPHRATRPDHFVIILRGLPGSGKSYLAKLLRDLEVENGGNAPRIHSMDDYFMTEVEKVDEGDSKSAARGKKPVTKMVMEYCYEPEMEEAYRSSMSKAFKKTLDEGTFSLVIVDDRNLRVADFAQFWATAKRSGYEVYLLEATYKDPAGCAARNVHSFTQDDIQKMAVMWEEAPPMYLKLDVKSLFQGDDENGIEEVDMDTGDGDSPGPINVSEQMNSGVTVSATPDQSPSDSSRSDKKWDAEGDPSRDEVKELGRSKWSSDLDDPNEKTTQAAAGNSLALSGLMKAYAKGGKSVNWGDKGGITGFSIGAARKASSSLVIGPGAGYNLKSNPLPEEEGLSSVVAVNKSSETKRTPRSGFQERIRAERESFKAVFDKRRRHRIGRLDLDED